MSLVRGWAELKGGGGGVTMICDWRELLVEGRHAWVERSTVVPDPSLSIGSTQPLGQLSSDNGRSSLASNAPAGRDDLFNSVTFSV